MIRLKRTILILIGFIMLGLGALGMFLPILPTTPFILVASICFSSSSQALHARMMKIPFVCTYIENYKTRAGLPQKTVIVSLISLWTMLTASAILAHRAWVVLLLACVGTSVTIHIMMISKPKEKKNTAIAGQEDLP